MDDTYILSPAKSLPSGWVWRDWDDYSGSLNAPNGTSYFQYDLSPYHAMGGIEYREQTTLQHQWAIFWGCLSEFKEYAESVIQKKYL